MQLIKFIRGSERIGKEQEYNDLASQEEKFIAQEKTKYEGEDKSKHELNAEMLKIAQVIDRENKMNKMWQDEDEDDEAESEEEDSRRKGRRADQTIKQTQRPKKEKFAEIMKNQEAFPTLENEFADDDDDEELSDK